jgi:hypothetical protein
VFDAQAPFPEGVAADAFGAVLHAVLRAVVWLLAGSAALVYAPLLLAGAALFVYLTHE